ncbi:hypothetical protein FA13DRAFT_1706096 [Coprinellus micaceus]|uniref:Uncharacterized protein n=1 Tax=Coprinellus micaceus TaxID=71717 RepID=A0A4Y7TSD7_COPMI|nr:hypothetical protein FA13DRAFT_1706096 [Coprinellus micaceus]
MERARISDQDNRIRRFAVEGWAAAIRILGRVEVHWGKWSWLGSRPDIRPPHGTSVEGVCRTPACLGGVERQSSTLGLALRKPSPSSNQRHFISGLRGTTASMALAQSTRAWRRYRSRFGVVRLGEGLGEGGCESGDANAEAGGRSIVWGVSATMPRWEGDGSSLGVCRSGWRDWTIAEMMVRIVVSGWMGYGCGREVDHDAMASRLEGGNGEGRESHGGGRRVAATEGMRNIPGIGPKAGGMRVGSTEVEETKHP